MSEEIQQLNAEQLDIEELERRMEMSAVMPLFSFDMSIAPVDCGVASCSTNSCSAF